MRTLLTLVVLLLLVLVGVDVGGRALAESKAGDALAVRASLATAPEVTIHGLSFLAQALPGRYQKVTVTSSGLRIGPIAGVGAVVQLYDVTLPLSDAIGGDVQRLAAGTAELHATFPVSEVLTALHQGAGTLTAAADGGLTLSSSVSLAGRGFPVSVELGIQIVGGSLQVRARSIRAAGISAAALPGLRSAFTLDVPLAGLPVPVQAGTVSVQGSRLVLDARLTDVTAGSLG